MKKALLILGFAIFGITVMSTAKAEQTIRDKFLVSRIYDYHDILLAEYLYDESNRLIKKIVKDHLVEPNKTIDRRWEDEFVYENGRVSKIKKYSLYIDNSPVTGFRRESNNETVYKYDSLGKLTDGSRYLYKEDFLVSTYGYTFGPLFYRDTLVYDNSMNVIKQILVKPELNAVGERISGTCKISTRNYVYDNVPKPNFGIDDLFLYNPYPYTNATDMIKALSKNNLTEARSEGYLYEYTYNENGLPETIETKFIGSEPLEPRIIKITYKQISTGLSEISKESPRVKVYPNPAKDIFSINCENLGTIKLYDMFGKEVLNQNINGKSDINISQLSKGIYNIKVLSEGKVVGNSRIVKQ